MEKPLPDNVEDKLTLLIKQFLMRLERNRAASHVSVDAFLDKDLGIDSIAKVELFHEVEDAFNIHLSNDLLGNALTVKDIVEAIKTGHPEIDFKSGIITPSLEATKFNPQSAESLAELLLNWAKHEPERPHIYIQNEKGDEVIITFKKLLTNARKVANGLYEIGIRSNDKVALMLPTSEEFFYCFMGVTLLGAVPVPIYPPFRIDKLEEYALREEKILEQAEVSVLITFAQAEKLSALLGILVRSLKTVTTYDKLVEATKNAPIATPKKNHSALIQFTSGSTHIPKGVLLTHDNLLANIRASGEAIKVTPTEVVVSWLPLYHDMGLIGCWFGSLYYACPLVIMSPLSFLTRPERWLWAIHYHRGTISAAPNFAYELCLKRIKDKDIEGLDLSSWRLSLNGAEAVNPNTIEGFIKKFEPYGFKAETMYPVYGLAENTVALSFPPLNRKPLIDKIDLHIYETQQFAEPTSDPKKPYLRIVSCGNAIPHHQLRIVDEKNTEVPERKVGSIQFKGPSMMQGYYNNKEATEEVFASEWCNTGDLGYMADKELYITGRKKDIIIKAGRNIYPEIIEEVTSHVQGVRKGCVAAFGVVDPILGTEKLVIVAESRENNNKLKDNMIKKIMERVTTAINVPPDEIKIVQPNVIPKTSSGKLQRSACKALYQKGKLSGWALPLWVQLGKIALKGVKAKLFQFVGTMAKFIYTIYVWLLIVVLMLPAWACIVILSSKSSRVVAKYASKCLLKLAFIQVNVKDSNNYLAKNNESCVLVANHASYADAVVLYSILPINYSFIGKKSLFKTPVLGSIMKKHEHFSVDREDATQSIEDTKYIIDSLKKGRALAIFPEGTFKATKGIQAFKTGAFKVAVEDSLPILPVALKGTRNILRSKDWLLRPSIVEVTVGELLKAEENSWQEMMRLSAVARQFIVAHSGEAAIES